MHKRALLLCLLIAAAGCHAEEGTPAVDTQAAGTPLAFPGAQGFAKGSTGGRGGEVVYVTTLANSGAGSFRDALMVGRTSKPRNVLFAVCGRIQLSSDIVMRAENLGKLTIAGQTAPCPVVVTNRNFEIAVPNATIRFLTLLEGGTSSDGGTIEAGYARYAKNMIFDHVSVGWHEDENFDILGGESGKSGKVRCANMYGSGIDCPENFTVQNSITAEGLSGPDVGKGFLSYGATNISLVRSLLASNYRRTPMIYDNTFEAVNNLIYNYSGDGERAMSLGAYWELGCHNIIGNHFKDGPSTIGSNVMLFMATTYDQDSSIFLQGNRHRTKRASDSDPEDDIIDNLNGAELTDAPPCPGNIAANDPAILDAFTGDAVLAHVLANAGNQRPGWTSDPWTKRILAEAGSGDANKGTQGKYSCTVNYNGNPKCDGSFLDIGDIGGWPTFESKTTDPADYDGDRDGIPDDCETANGLNPDSAADGATVTASGYTNLEQYLNATAGDPVTGWSACDGSGGGPDPPDPGPEPEPDHEARITTLETEVEALDKRVSELENASD